MRGGKSSADGPSGGEVQRVSSPGLARFFEGLVRRSFGELWIWDHEVADYVVNLLVRFARTDALYRIRNPQGQRLETVVDLLIEAAGGAPLLREREVRQHIGDYTLFMTGIFRDFAQRHGFFGFYLREGEKAYRDTARLDRMLYRSGASLFEALARQFEMISGALDYMKKVYFRPAAQGGPYHRVLRRFERWE